MKAYIVDDEQSSIEVIQELLKDYKQIELLGSSTTVEKSISEISDLKPDLLFMDIELGEILSFQLLEQLDYTNFQIIFITAYDHYALSAVKFCAIDYLLKPVDLDELDSAINNAEAKYKNSAAYKNTNSLIDHIKSEEKELSRLALPNQQGYEICHIDKIEYCKADGNYTEFHLSDQSKVVVSKKIKHYEGLLADYDFIRIHNSYLINLKLLKHFNKSDGGYVIMESGKELSVSQSRRKALTDVFLK